MQAILDMQLASMKAYNPASFGADPGVHFITQRYALLTTSLLSLNADYQDGQMDHNIDRLRFGALELLRRLARRFPRQRAATIFLVNNFYHIVQARAATPLCAMSCTAQLWPLFRPAMSCSMPRHG
jgi:hypothetical protein